LYELDVIAVEVTHRVELTYSKLRHSVFHDADWQWRRRGDVDATPGRELDMA